ncbi:MAG: hypothetical protein SGJ27_03730 [Candidatus Melainabacteria bacterium]|nr:hypothetical protein [Candidatus Melainabacteria bacterium]
MGKKSKQKKPTGVPDRILGWFEMIWEDWIWRHRLRLLSWFGLMWLVVAFVVANWTAPKTVPIPNTQVIYMEKELKEAEKPGRTIPDIQKLRAKLIFEYINNFQIVKAREQLLTYRNWLETNKDLTLEERLDMHHQLSNIHVSLGEFEFAVNEYDQIMKELATQDDPESRILKARYLNNRGVANFLLSQGSQKDALRKKYLASSIKDFEESKNLVASSNDEPTFPETKNELGYIEQINKDNRAVIERDMAFMPAEVKP